MILNDLAEVIYAPQKAFKRIVANPKYLGAIIVLILFIALQVGYQYSQFSKTNTEQTTPAADQLYMFTNATARTSDNTPAWRSSSNVTNNFNDPLNYSVYVAAFGFSPNDPNAYYSLFRNFSLQMAINNTNTLTSTLDIETALRSINEIIVAQNQPPLSKFDIDCTQNGFQNLSIVLKQVEPQTAPQNATLTLYSLSDSNYYQYDLTAQLSNAANLGEWNNITVSLGPTYEDQWTVNGAPQWNNITSLQLDFNYASNENVTIRLGAVFFHGQYLTPIQYNSTGILLQFLQLFSLQFLFAWFILTGIIYLICKILKGNLTWRPLFVALGLAMMVMVIRALINIVASLTLPALYYPFDLSLGVRFDPAVALYYPSEAIGTLSTQSQAVFANINAATAAFRAITSGIAIVSYVWLGALAGIVIKSLKPEFSTVKCLAIAAISLAVTVLLLVFLVGAF